MARKYTLKFISLYFLSSLVLLHRAYASFYDYYILPGGTKSRYCQWGECWIDRGIDLVWTWIDWVETWRSFSVLIQDIAIYILWYVSLIAVIYILYAWFRILIWNGDEEQLKKSKAIILYVILWLIVMWLAWTITNFILTVLSA